MGPPDLLEERLPAPLRGAGPLAARVLGDGEPTVVLVHGLARCAATWGPVASEFAASRRVILLENPGFGANRGTRAPLSVEAHAALHAATLEAIDRTGELHVVGLSLGGMIATSLAARLGPRCRSVSLLAASCRESGGGRLRLEALARILGRLCALRSRYAAPLPELVSERTRGEHPDLASRLQQLHRREGIRRGTISRQLLAAWRFRLTPLIPRLPAGRLVVVGEDDRFVHPANSRRIATLLGASLEIISGAGHDLALDAPQAVVAHVERLVKGC